jgi:hypothetical protein
VSVPSSELDPHLPLRRKQVFLLPWTQRVKKKHFLAGEGAGGARFGRLERKHGTLYTLCALCFSPYYLVLTCESDLRLAGQYI